jgi:predicted transcriptional regulator
MPRPRAFDHAQAQKLRERGLTYRDISEELGVTCGAVYRACNEAARLAHRDYSIEYTRQARERAKRTKRMKARFC